jgi:hypothetical protein
MARTNGAGHNSGAPLTEEEQAALQQLFASKIRAQRKRALLKKAEYDSEREQVNGLFSQARGELGMTRKELEELLAAEDLDEDAFLAQEAARNRRFSLQGLPMGTQMDMFAKRGDAADEQALAYQNGLRAGKRGDDPEAPKTISGVFVSEWARGWHDGQAHVAETFARGEAVLAARNAKKPVLTEEPPEEEDDGEELTEAAIKAGAKRLKASKFMEPTPAETEFAPA